MGSNLFPPSHMGEKNPGKPRQIKNIKSAVIQVCERVNMQEREIASLKIAFTPFQNIQGKLKKENNQVIQSILLVSQEIDGLLIGFRVLLK